MPDGLCARTPFDQRPRHRRRFAEHIGLDPRLIETLGDDLLFVGPVGAPQLGPVDRARPVRSQLRELSVAMLVLLARAAWARRVAADRRFDDAALRSRCGSGGCGMLSGGRFDSTAPVAASMSAVSSSPENGSRCWVMKSGSTGGGASSSWTCARISIRVTSSRIDDQQSLEQQECLLLIFVDRLLLGIAPQVDHLAQRVERREMLLPVLVERLDQDLLLDSFQRSGSTSLSFAAMASSASSCSRSMIISGSTASSSSHSSIGG